TYVGLLAKLQRRYPSWLSTGNSDPADDVTGPVDWVVGVAMLLPRLLFESVGGFDERYFMYMEEVDLQRRLRLLGVPSILIADLDLLHEHGKSSGGIDIPVELLRSRLLYEEKWHGSRRRAVLRSMLAAGFVLDGAADRLLLVRGRQSADRGLMMRRLEVLAAAAKPREAAR
ncbi:MAG: hypothetical protein WCI74_11075, partial [Actinomycetes bacterium]